MHHSLSIPLLLSAALVLPSCNNSNKSGPESSSTAGVVPVVTASGVQMVYLPGGEFTMGSDKESPDEKPARKVNIVPFLIDQFEVTAAMFEKAELPNPSHWQGEPSMPIEQIRWRDARAYCNERSLLEGLDPCYDESKPGWPCNFEANGYRLPTEAEWEYAARAGGTGRYGSIDARKLKQPAWFEENSGKRTHPVGTRKPNAWGLCDMLGNVSEWCQDIYDPNYYAQSPADNPTGPADSGASAAKRVMRGGNWKSSADMCRVTFRQGQLTGDTDACFTTDYCGFRCVRRITPEELGKLKNR
jgi:formylglycine-generating enzyme required for sulfatase activity